MKAQKIFNLALLSEGIVVIGLVIVWCNLVGYLRGWTEHERIWGSTPAWPFAASASSYHYRRSFRLKGFAEWPSAHNLTQNFRR